MSQESAGELPWRGADASQWLRDPATLAGRKSPRRMGVGLRIKITVKTTVAYWPATTGLLTSRIRRSRGRRGVASAEVWTKLECFAVRIDRSLAGAMDRDAASTPPP